MNMWLESNIGLQPQFEWPQLDGYASYEYFPCVFLCEVPLTCSLSIWTACKCAKLCVGGGLHSGQFALCPPEITPTVNNRAFELGFLIRTPEEHAHIFAPFACLRARAYPGFTRIIGTFFLPNECRNTPILSSAAFPMRFKNFVSTLESTSALFEFRRRLFTFATKVVMLTHWAWVVESPTVRPKCESNNRSDTTALQCSCSSSLSSVFLFFTSAWNPAGSLLRGYILDLLLVLRNGWYVCLLHRHKR